MRNRYPGPVVERRYTGKKWSVGIGLLLVYWLAMFGMVVNGVAVDRVVINNKT